MVVGMNDLFTTIDHVGVAVPDLDAAIAYYRDVLGMSLAHREVNEEQGVEEAMMAVGDSGSHVQLLAPLNESSTIAKFLDRSGPGLQQIAYRVEDIDAVCATLRERGARLLYDSPGAAPRAAGSTSSIPGAPVAYSWNWWNPLPGEVRHRTPPTAGPAGCLTS